MKTLGENSHPQADKRVLRRNQPANTLIWGFYTLGLSGSKFLLFKPPGMWNFVMGALTK